MLGGFVGDVILTNNSTKYLVKSPNGKVYTQKKIAKQAIAEVALHLIESDKMPPLLQEQKLEPTALSDNARLERLAELTGHVFQNPVLALRAMRHASAGSLNNEALAFLGDACIGYRTAQRAYASNPNASARELHLARQMVENENFERISNRVGLTELLEVGNGMNRSLVRGKMVADMFEAIIAVLDLEGGKEAVLRFWDRCV